MNKKFRMNKKSRRNKKRSEEMNKLLKIISKLWFNLTLSIGAITIYVLLKIVNSIKLNNDLSTIITAAIVKFVIKINPQIKMVTNDGKSIKTLPWEEMFKEGVPSPFIIMNHVTLLDGFIFAASIPSKYLIKIRNIRIFAKYDTFKMFFLGPIMRYCGNFPVYFSGKKGFEVNKEAQRQVMDRVHEHVKNGGAIALYPEGQLNRKNIATLNEFRRGSLEVARQYNMPLWGIIYTGINKVWPVDKSTGGYPATIKVNLFKFPDISKEVDIKEYTNMVQEFMQKKLDSMVQNNNSRL